MFCSKNSQVLISFSQYFTSINKALEGSNEGDRIIVHPGVYNELVMFNKSVSLIGASPEKVLLVNSTTTVVEIEKSLKNLSLCNVEIKVK